MAWRELSPERKRRWWEWLASYNLLLHREYPMGTRLAPSMDNWDRPTDATPHYSGDNFPNGEVSDFEYLRGVRRLGGKVLFEFWDLPRWATDTESWARAVVAYCRRAQRDIVGLQNERTQPSEKWHAMTLVLRRELDAPPGSQRCGFTCRTPRGWRPGSSPRGRSGGRRQPGAPSTSPLPICTTSRSTSPPRTASTRRWRSGAGRRRPSRSCRRRFR